MKAYPYSLLFLIFLSLSSFGHTSAVSKEDQKLKEVLNRLLAGLGYESKINPNISLIPTRTSPGKYVNNKIGIEEKVYLKLDSNGVLNEGLAFLIGHELGHFELDEKYTHNYFSVIPVDPKRYKEKPCTEKCKEMEQYCDNFACFAAHRAGYDIWQKADKIFDAICSAYDCKGDHISDSKEGRLAIMKNLEESIKNMSNLFDLGNQLVVMGEYTQARNCYDTIAKNFPSREIKNNLALSYMLESLEHITKQPNCWFAYPFELDHETRLNEGVRGTDEDDKKEFEDFTKSAIDILSSFEGLYSDYPPVKFNLGCAHILRGNTEDARYYFEKCLPSGESVLSEKAQFGIALTKVMIDSSDTKDLNQLKYNATDPLIRQMSASTLHRIINKEVIIESDKPGCSPSFRGIQKGMQAEERKVVSGSFFYKKEDECTYYKEQERSVRICSETSFPNSIREVNQLFQVEEPSNMIPLKEGAYYVYKCPSDYVNPTRTKGVLIQTNKNGKIINYSSFKIMD